MLGIPVVDHIIITGLNRQDVYSFRAQGVLEAHGHYQTENMLAEKKPAYDSKDKHWMRSRPNWRKGSKKFLPAASLPTISRSCRASIATVSTTQF